AQLVLADLDLVAVLELMGLDAAPVDVRSVQGTKVVDVEPVATPHDQRVVAGNRHIVEENRCIRRPPDADPLALNREALARPPSLARSGGPGPLPPSPTLRRPRQARTRQSRRPCRPSSRHPRPPAGRGRRRTSGSSSPLRG